MTIFSPLMCAIVSRFKWILWYKWSIHAVSLDKKVILFQRSQEVAKKFKFENHKFEFRLTTNQAGKRQV